MHIDTERHVLHCDSVAEVIKESQSSRWLNSSMDSDFAPLSGDEAIKRATSGCNVAAARAAALIEQFSDELESSSWQDEPTVAGCYPVVPEFLAGEPECMRLPTQVGSVGAPLAILVDLGSSWKIKPDELELRGAAVMALVQALSAQRPVTLHVAYVCESDNESGTAATVVQIDTAPLDLATTAFILADASFTRRVIYGATKAHDLYSNVFPRYVSANTGNLHTQKFSDRHAQALGIEGEVLIVPPVFLGDPVGKNPVAWLRKTLAQYGTQRAE